MVTVVEVSPGQAIFRDVGAGSVCACSATDCVGHIFQCWLASAKSVSESSQVHSPRAREQRFELNAVQYEL